MDTTSECSRFAERANLYLAPLLKRYGFTQASPVEYFGVDPKGAGKLCMALFESVEVRLLVRTRDGTAEVLVGPRSSAASWQDDGWLWPHQIDSAALRGAPSQAELIELRDNLSNSLVGWA
jgi:hypothetical protein